MNQLPQSIKDRIEKDAEKNWPENLFPIVSQRRAYIHGGFTEALRAQPLLEALEAALKQHKEDAEKLYAKYPELKEQFQEAIHPWVKQAEEAIKNYNSK